MEKGPLGGVRLNASALSSAALILRILQASEAKMQMAARLYAKAPDWLQHLRRRGGGVWSANGGVDVTGGRCLVCTNTRTGG